MLVSPEQPQKAPVSIEVTLFGIVMLVSSEQPTKALFPIEVTGFSSIVVGISTVFCPVGSSMSVIVTLLVLLSTV